MYLTDTPSSLSLSRFLLEHRWSHGFGRIAASGQPSSVAWAALELWYGLPTPCTAQACIPKVFLVTHRMCRVSMYNGLGCLNSGRASLLRSTDIHEILPYLHSGGA